MTERQLAAMKGEGAPSLKQIEINPDKFFDSPPEAVARSLKEGGGYVDLGETEAAQVTRAAIDVLKPGLEKKNVKIKNNPRGGLLVWK